MKDAIGIIAGNGVTVTHFNLPDHNPKPSTARGKRRHSNRTDDKKKQAEAAWNRNRSNNKSKKQKALEDRVNRNNEIEFRKPKENKWKHDFNR